MSKVFTDQIEKRTGGTAIDLPATGKWPTANIADNAIGNTQMADDAVGVAELSATGTANATTFLRGDNAWTEIVMGLTWEAIQTSAFTAVAGKAYPVNTTAAAMNVTLPASPSAGDEVLILDYAGTFDTNAITLLNNGSNIMGDTSTERQLILEFQATRFRFVDATGGWFPIVNGSGADLANREYMAALGPDGAAGTIDGDYKVHTFTASKTGVNAFRVTAVGNAAGSNTVEYLVIAGGGGGGGQHGGGGGAGGYLAASGYTLSAGVANYDVTIGGGGATSTGPASNMTQATNGVDSVWDGKTSTGGGGGGSYRTPAPWMAGADGGSGGGGGSGETGSPTGGKCDGTVGQGYDGGVGAYSGGGGGGAYAIGTNSNSAYPGGTSVGGAGGDGIASLITVAAGPAIYRAGGGGGGQYNNTTTGGNDGGAGGGGNGGCGGGHPGGTPATAATVNTGSGGGGGSIGGTNPGTAGASGVVIIRYKFQN